MRFRNRRRRGRAPSAAPAPTPPPPLDLTTEIEQSVEARDKFETTAALFSAQREQEKLAFLRKLAADLRATEITADQIRDRLAKWKAEEARAAEQNEALKLFLPLFADRVAGFKTSSRVETAVAIQRIITRLTEERGKPGADQTAINNRIKKLNAELEELQAKLPPAPPRDPKDREAPPERKSKEKAK